MDELNGDAQFQEAFGRMEPVSHSGRPFGIHIAGSHTMVCIRFENVRDSDCRFYREEYELSGLAIEARIATDPAGPTILEVVTTGMRFEEYPNTMSSGHTTEMDALLDETGTDIAQVVEIELGLEKAPSLRA